VSCFGNPDDWGRSIVRIDFVEVVSKDEMDVQCTGEGVAGAGGIFAGASKDFVAFNNEGERLGGIRKWI
jgi:hypothetical protein